MDLEHSQPRRKIETVSDVARIKGDLVSVLPPNFYEHSIISDVIIRSLAQEIGYLMDPEAAQQAFDDLREERAHTSY